MEKQKHHNQARARPFKQLLALETSTSLGMSNSFEVQYGSQLVGACWDTQTG